MLLERLKTFLFFRAPGLNGRKGSSCIVALKSTSVGNTTSESLEKEAETLASLSHPNIVRLLAICQSTKSFFRRQTPFLIASHNNCKILIEF